ncbi:heavy metal sensor histidine kinase [Thalassolituus sp. LLYu03]|uniref:heavy metal sensor histidine kinase n=1 Tax=Thalassolituus sp. LLYu03 TaxID=3421656 RepID=UPI003D2D0C35
MTPEPSDLRAANSRRPMSLTQRVLLFVSLAIGLSLALNATLILRSIGQHFAEQDASELQALAARLQTLLEHPDNRPLQDALLPLVSDHHGVDYQLQDATGTVLFAARNPAFAEAAAFIAPGSSLRAADLQLWHSDGHDYRGGVLTLKAGDKNYRLTLAVDMGFHLHFLHSFRYSLWLIMALTGAVTLLAAALAVYQGHLPLRGLSQRMRGIQTSKLDVRLDAAALPAELSELAQSFNQMIGRLQTGFEQLAHYSSDIAHELRTPLTSLITQTQVTLSKPRDTDTYRELLYSSLEELERLSKLVGDMLWLAKSDNQLLTPQLKPLQLAVEVQELFEFFEALAAEKDIHLSLTGEAPEVAGDRNLLRRALSNLLSNALRHTPAGAEVQVQLSSADGQVSVTVSNPGHIDAQHLPHLFDRFYRADASRQRLHPGMNPGLGEGAGLGLAIARSVVRAHGGDMSVRSEQGVVQFTIGLPLAV